MTVYVRSELAANRAFENLTSFIEGKLLGFSFTRGPEVKRRIAPKALEKLQGKVRKLTRPGRLSFLNLIGMLQRYLVGWRTYFGYCQTPSVLRSIDSWIRRRLRALIWRRWKTCARRQAELRKRGVNREAAAKLAGSSLGPWYLSRMTALQYAFPSQWFNDHGLPILQPNH